MTSRDPNVETLLQMEHREVSELERYINKIEGYITKNSLLSQEIILARREYQEKTGKIKENYVEYENKINAFLYWFIFDWQCTKLNLDTPYTVFFKMNVNSFTPKELDVYKDLPHHHHSIFEFIKITSKETVVFDLFTRKKLLIPDTQTLFNFEKGCMFETRIFTVDGKPAFAPYFVLHPFKANKVIKKQFKLIKKDADKKKELLLRLEYLNFKLNTYTKFDADKIYVF